MKAYTIVGFAIGLLWFLILQFYWPPVPELTDIILMVFYWPCVVTLVILIVLGARNYFYERYGTPYVIIGFVISLLWFVSLQFYWPPTTGLTDIVVSAFFWPGVSLLVFFMTVGFMRLYREMLHLRFKLKAHNKTFAEQMYIALRRNADLSDTDFDIYTLEEVQTALKVAYSESRK